MVGAVRARSASSSRSTEGGHKRSLAAIPDDRLVRLLVVFVTPSVAGATMLATGDAAGQDRDTALLHVASQSVQANAGLRRATQPVIELIEL